MSNFDSPLSLKLWALVHTLICSEGINNFGNVPILGSGLIIIWFLGNFIPISDIVTGIFPTFIAVINSRSGS